MTSGNTDLLLSLLPYAIVTLVFGLVCSAIALSVFASAVRWFFVSRRRAREGRTVQWAYGAYGLWTGGEDSGQWNRDRGVSSLRDWYGVEDSAAFWAQIKELEQGQTGNPSWDQVRALDLLRIGVAAGYITDDECWDAVRRIATSLRGTYRSWEELARAFETGMLEWHDRRGVTDEQQRGRVQRNLPTLRQYTWPNIPWDAAI
jgi:hypothetical protein